MTRWIIPAGLVPLRSVVNNAPVEEPPPIRFVYTVGLKSGLTESEAPQGTVFYANDWDGNPESQKVALAHFVPGPDNRFYSVSSETAISKSGGDSTNTGGNATERRPNTGVVCAYNLRNNGRLEIPCGSLTA